MGSLTLAQVRNGLKDRTSLVRFVNDALGYRAAPVFYGNPTQDLRIPSYVSAKINSWWLICSYPGKILFQIHLAEIKELTFYICKDIAVSFLRSHPANYLFIFTRNYCHIAFFCVDRSLEKRPYTWELGTKYYYRFLVMDCHNPKSNDLRVLDSLRLDASTTDAIIVYDKVIEALNLATSDVPEWFMQWYYQMGYSKETYDKLRESGMI